MFDYLNYKYTLLFIKLYTVFSHFSDFDNLIWKDIRYNIKNRP